MSFFLQSDQIECVYEPFIGLMDTSILLKLQSSIVGPLLKSLQYPSNFEQIKYAAFFKTDDQIIPAQPNVKPSHPEEGWRQVGDRDMWFSSKWHANCAKYLEVMKISGLLCAWQYKPKTFRVCDVRGGYAPSFQVFRNDETHFWIEIKTTCCNLDLWEKVLLFQRAYPDEELCEVDFEWFKENLGSLRRHISTWEDCW